MQIINSAPSKQQQLAQQWPLNDIYLPNQMNGNLMPKDLNETDLKSLFKGKSGKKPLQVNSYNSLVLMFQSQRQMVPSNTSYSNFQIEKY